jgi:hypothetical protein
MKKSYFKLSGSTEPAISGVKEITQLYDFIDPKNTNPPRMALYQEYSAKEFLSEEKYDLQKFRMRDNAKTTNIITSAFLNRGGLFVSEKLKQIIENNNTLYQTSFYKTHITQKEKQYLYYYMNTLNAVEVINFEQSEFVYDDIFETGNLMGDPVEVSDYETFVRLKRECITLRSGQTLLPKKIVLKEQYDLLREPLGVSVLISEALKNKIEDAGIEDITIERVRYEI